MKKIKTIMKVIEVALYIFITAVIIGIGFNAYGLIAGSIDSSWPLIILMFTFGILILVLIMLGYVKEQLKDNLNMFEVLGGFEDEENETFRERFEREQNDFLKTFKKVKKEKNHHDSNVIIDVEPLIIDPFEGDAVYDNLDNIFGYTKRVVDGEQDQATRNYVDAEFTVKESKPIKKNISIGLEDDLPTFTVVELKEMCKAYKIRGYSTMRKEELISVLEEYNRVHNF